MVDPFAGERGDRPGADEELTLPVDDEAEPAARILLVGTADLDGRSGAADGSPMFGPRTGHASHHRP